MRHFTSLLFVFSFFLSCSDTEVLVRYQDRNLVADLGPCTHDAECVNGRCIGGVCVSADCIRDDECRENEICNEGKCVKANTFDCQNERRPLAQISSRKISFGAVHLGQKVWENLTISNLGDCALTLKDIRLEQTKGKNFECSHCDIGNFPLLVAPTRSIDVKIGYGPETPGAHNGRLVLIGDDLTLGKNGALEIILEGSYEGQAQLHLEPAQVDWGYVPFVLPTTNAVEKHVRVSNIGTGNAAILVESIMVARGDFFALPQRFSESLKPTWLQPKRRGETDSLLTIPIVFIPKSYAKYQDQLVIGVRDFGADQSRQISVPLYASSLGKPSIKISHDELLFRSASNEPVSIGSLTTQELQITNVGHADLVISDMILSPFTQDFSFFPTFLSHISPGQSATLSLFFAPTRTYITGAQAFSTYSSQLHLASNDPNKPTVAVALSGWAKNTIEETLSIEMTFENAQSGWSTNDFRDVDLELISPTGFSCAKPKPIYAATGGLVRLRDYCEEWNQFGREGKTHWIALGQFEKPERVSLYGFESGSNSEHIFTARVHYVEDCSNMPTALLANLLGLSTSALTSVLGGYTGVDISTSPARISEIISKHCFAHAPSLATVKVLVNGREIAAPQTLLYQKGDSTDLIKIRRRDGKFEILR